MTNSPDIRQRTRGLMPALRLPRVLVPLALAAVLSLLAAGCGGSSGPLGAPQAGSHCVTYGQGQPVTIGLLELHNTGPDPVTVQSVRLESAHNLTMTTAWLLPIQQAKLLGAGAAYPPTGSATWRQRKNAVGGVIRPGEHVNLVFGLTRVANKNGLAAGEAIDYSANHTSYTLTEGLELIVSHDCELA